MADVTKFLMTDETGQSIAAAINAINPNDAVRYSAQTLTDAQKTQARSNIGAISEDEVDVSTKADKVSGATSGHLAGLDSNGNLTDSDIPASDVTQLKNDLTELSENAVLTTEQVLTEEQKAQARANIGAEGISDANAAIDDLLLNNGVINGYQYDMKFEQGAIGGTGSPFSSNNDIRTGFIKVIPSKYHVHRANTSYHAYMLCYDANQVFVSGRNIWNKTSDFDFEIAANDTVKFVRFDVSTGDSQPVLPVDNALVLSIIGAYKDIAYLIKNGNIIPDYYTESWLKERTNKIISNCLVTKGTSFAFITDIHLEDNSGSSKILMKYFLDNTPVPFVFTGGDIPTAFSTVAGNEKDEVFEDARKWLSWVDYWGQDRVYQLRGNHDYVLVARNDSTKVYYMPDAGVHHVVSSKFRTRVHMNETNRNYYYFDDELQKIRYIVLDGHNYNANYPTVVVSWMYFEQSKWLCETLLDSDGYDVIILSHEAYNANMASYAPNLSKVGNILAALKNHTVYSEFGETAWYHADFAESTANIVAFISGHSHKSQSDFDDNGILSISTTCDASYVDEGISRTKGTVNESAFDIFSIDTDAKTIKTVRIGAGSDRAWNYETGEEIVE